MNDFYERSLTLSPGDVDVSDRLRPSVLLRLTQDTLEEQNRRMGVDRSFLGTLGATWMVSRAQVDVRRMPRSGERVTLQVWLGKPCSVLFPRGAAMLTESGETLWEYSALWVPVSLSGRTLMEPELLRYFPPLTASGREVTLPPPRVAFPAEPERSESRSVRYSELDCNGHLNNCRYMDWAEDLLPVAYHRGHTLRSLWVDFRSEIPPESTPLLRSTLQDDTLFVQGVHADTEYFKMRVSYDSI